MAVETSGLFQIKLIEEMNEIMSTVSTPNHSGLYLISIYH